MNIFYFALGLFLLLAVLFAVLGLTNPAKRRTRFIQAGFALLAALLTWFAIILINGMIAETKVSPAEPQVIIVTATPEVVQLASSTPVILATSTFVPTFTPTVAPPTATFVPTATATTTEVPALLSREQILKLACLNLGTKHPNSGKPLIFAINPYPQDPRIGCEFEAYSDSEDLIFTVTRGAGMIGTDWFMGYQRDTDNNLTDLCKTGPDCEGTFVLGSSDHDVTVVIKRGTMFHGYLYWSLPHAVSDFLGDGSGTNQTSFACRYIWYGGPNHSNENIRPAIMPFVSFDHLLVNPADISIWGHLKNCATAPLP